MQEQIPLAEMLPPLTSNKTVPRLPLHSTRPPGPAISTPPGIEATETKVGVVNSSSDGWRRNQTAGPLVGQLSCGTRHNLSILRNQAQICHLAAHVQLQPVRTHCDLIHKKTAFEKTQL